MGALLCFTGFSEIADHNTRRDSLADVDALRVYKTETESQFALLICLIVLLYLGNVFSILGTISATIQSWNALWVGGCDSTK